DPASASRPADGRRADGCHGPARRLRRGRRVSASDARSGAHLRAAQTMMPRPAADALPLPVPDASAAQQETSRVSLSVVVPCFDEEEVIPELYRRLTAACAATGVIYEIILVNDGSRDRTWQRIAALAERDKAVVGVDLSRNHGHQLALTAGLSLCRGERIF